MLTHGLSLSLLSALHAPLSLGGRRNILNQKREKKIFGGGGDAGVYGLCTVAVGARSSNVAAANLLLDWQPLMWKEDQSKDGGTQPTRRKRATHTHTHEWMGQEVYRRDFGERQSKKRENLLVITRKARAIAHSESGLIRSLVRQVSLG
jgi:hypothetical protein